MDAKLSNTFSNLRFILALLVVYIHIDNDCPYAFSQLTGGGIWTMSYYGSNIIISQTIARLAVPIFFVMSGYLFFRNMHNMTLITYTAKLRNRVNTLIIPYFIWNILAALFLMYIKHQETPNNLSGFLYWLFVKPANFPLWFVRDLIMLVVISPFIYFIIKKYNPIIFVFLLLMYVCCPNISVGVISIESFVFFSLGSAFALWNLSVAQIPSFGRIVICLLALLLGIIMIITYGERNEYMFNLYLLIASIALLILIYHQKFKVSNILVSSSFFVFASHRLGITGIAKSIFVFIPDLMIRQTISYLIAPIIVYVFCMVLYVFIKRISPSVAIIINGR